MSNCNQASSESQSTADVIKVKLPSGDIVWKVLVTLDDGQQFMSEQFWGTPQAAEAQLRVHLRELGVPDDKIGRHTVN